MSRKEIIKLAREAGIDWSGQRTKDVLVRAMQVAYAAGAAAEREACAKVCESMRPSKQEYDQRFYTACTLNANAIRARSQA